jgi:hypothetical protein
MPRIHLPAPRTSRELNQTQCPRHFSSAPAHVQRDERFFVAFPDTLDSQDPDACLGLQLSAVGDDDFGLGLT